MKNSMKFAFAGMMLVVLSVGAFAQNSASTSASVTSTLLTQLTITKNNDVVFGQVATGTIPTLAANSATKSYVGSNAALGKFTVVGTSGATVKISYDENVTLTNGGVAADGQLTFTPSVYRTALTAGTYGSTEVTNNSTYTVNASNSNAVAGTDLLFVGGTLTESGTLNAIPALGANLKTGDYSGTFNITATYN